MDSPSGDLAIRTAVALGVTQLWLVRAEYLGTGDPYTDERVCVADSPKQLREFLSQSSSMLGFGEWAVTAWRFTLPNTSPEQVTYDDPYEWDITIEDNEGNPDAEAEEDA